MSNRVCINPQCQAPYGKMHKKGCPSYVEPTYTRAMLEKFFRDNGRTFIDPVEGVKKEMISISDLDKLESMFYR